MRRTRPSRPAPTLSPWPAGSRPLNSAIAHRTSAGRRGRRGHHLAQRPHVRRVTSPPVPPADSRPATLWPRAQHAAERLARAASESPATTGQGVEGQHDARPGRYNPSCVVATGAAVVETHLLLYRSGVRRPGARRAVGGGTSTLAGQRIASCRRGRDRVVAGPQTRRGAGVGDGILAAGDLRRAHQPLRRRHRDVRPGKGSRLPHV